MSVVCKVEWCDSSWNPVRGCSEISPGCAHCYARTHSERFRGVKGSPFEFGFDLRLVPEKMDQPLRWKKPRRIFVNSISDIFHADVPDDYILEICETMMEADWHTYQVLTKRSERMKTLLMGKLRPFAEASHIWWGVSVENRKHGLPRIAHLQEAAPAVAFLSIEPLLEDLGPLDLQGIKWVIVGGESGAGFRAVHPDWIRSIRDQCQVAEIPFFFKQWGGFHKGQAGRLLDGIVHEEFPVIPKEALV